MHIHEKSYFKHYADDIKRFAHFKIPMKVFLIQIINNLKCRKQTDIHKLTGKNMAFETPFWATNKLIHYTIEKVNAVTH